MTNAAFYFRYFAQDSERSYYSRKFGQNLAIYLLDSGHVTAHGERQAAWLDVEMEADAKVPHRFAVYHVPLYPAFRAFEGSLSATGRVSWLPIFDRHHLTAAFEHHDHVFKRTKLLRDNKEDPGGTLYLGDGCWGMGARPLGPTRKWYEVKAASLQHFWQVDVWRDRVEYRAVNKEGKVFDVYPPQARVSREAEAVYEELTRPTGFPAGRATPK